MGERGRSGWGLLALILLPTGICGGYLAYRVARGTSGEYVYHSSTRPASTRPATRIESQPADPASKPVKPKPPTTTFLDAVRASHPKSTSIHILEVPNRDLADAARLVLKDPIYLGQPYRADLWVTRNDGLTTDETLKRAMDFAEYPQFHVVRDLVRFVHWNPGDTSPKPFLVCEKSDGTFEVISPGKRQAIPSRRAYDWARANSWNDRIVVPSSDGVSVFRFEPTVVEAFHELIPPDAPNATNRHAAPLALLDFQGLVAWVPADAGHTGSRGAARYVDDAWTPLGPDQGWPEQLVHLVPLLDGSILQVVAGAEGSVKLSVATLYEANIDEPKIVALVEQLSDADAERREAAFKALSQYGSGIFKILERLVGDQPPESRARIRSLLRSQVTPTLGGMTLLGDKLQVVTRHPDGGAVFYAPAGVSVPRESSDPLRRVPAWLSVRPGRAVEVLEEAFVQELDPEKCEINASGNGDWFVTGDAPGPRRWVGSGFVPLLKKSESAYTEVIGTDRRGRWLFRNPAAPTETLILDPNLSDPTPRLPAWEYTAGRAFGWDAEGWPTVRRENGDWALRETGWTLLDEKKGEMLTVDVPRPAWMSPASGPTTGVSSRPATTTAATTSPAAGDTPILVTADGTRYYDGINSLRVKSTDGRSIDWHMPPTATGTGIGTPTLLRTDDGALFLFNQPGRVLRLAATPGAEEPFAIEAIFTRKIPSTDAPRRIWLDPAGRIILVDARRLVIYFPDGAIPPRIRDLMPLDPMENGE